MAKQEFMASNSPDVCMKFLLKSVTSRYFQIKYTCIFPCIVKAFERFTVTCKIFRKSVFSNRHRLSLAKWNAESNETGQVIHVTCGVYIPTRDEETFKLHYRRSMRRKHFDLLIVAWQLFISLLFFFSVIIVGECYETRLWYWTEIIIVPFNSTIKYKNVT